MKTHAVDASRYLIHQLEKRTMSKTLFTGLGALLIGGIFKIGLPLLGINIDISVLEDGTITWSDLALVAGYILLYFAAPVKNDLRKTSIGFKFLGAPPINNGSGYSA